jgi:hypothetical protein
MQAAAVLTRPRMRDWLFLNRVPAHDGTVETKGRRYRLAFALCLLIPLCGTAGCVYDYPEPANTSAADPEPAAPSPRPYSNLPVLEQEAKNYAELDRILKASREPILLIDEGHWTARSGGLARQRRTRRPGCTRPLRPVLVLPVRGSPSATNIQAPLSAGRDRPESHRGHAAGHCTSAGARFRTSGAAQSGRYAVDGGSGRSTCERDASRRPAFTQEGGVLTNTSLCCWRTARSAWNPGMRDRRERRWANDFLYRL